jgi:hypothetical protein
MFNYVCFLNGGVLPLLMKVKGIAKKIRSFDFACIPQIPAPREV